LEKICVMGFKGGTTKQRTDRKHQWEGTPTEEEEGEAHRMAPEVFKGVTLKDIIHKKTVGEGQKKIELEIMEEKIKLRHDKGGELKFEKK